MNLLQPIYLLHHKRLKQQVIPDRVVQWSTPWVLLLWCLIKVPLDVCGFSPSLRMTTIKNPHLSTPPGPTNMTTMTRQHTQFSPTFFYSLAPRSLAFHEIPSYRILVQKECFSNSSPFLVLTFQIIYQYPRCESI